MTIMIFSLAIGISSRSRMKRILISWGRWYEDLGSMGSLGSAVLGKVFETVFFLWGQVFAWFADPLLIIMTPGVSNWLILRVFLMISWQKCLCILVLGSAFFLSGSLKRVDFDPILCVFCIYECSFCFFFFLFLKKKEKKQRRIHKTKEWGQRGLWGQQILTKVYRKKKRSDLLKNTTYYCKLKYKKTLWKLLTPLTPKTRSPGSRLKNKYIRTMGYIYIKSISIITNQNVAPKKLL